MNRKPRRRTKQPKRPPERTLKVDQSLRNPPCHLPVGLESPYLTMEEAGAYMRYQTVHTFRQAVKKFGIPHIRRGRKFFFLKSKLDEFMSVATEATRFSSPRRRR